MYENSIYLIFIGNKTIRLIIGKSISILRKNMQTTYYEIKNKIIRILKDSIVLTFPIKLVVNLV